MTNSLKLGKLPFQPDKRDFKLKSLTAVPLPPVPTKRFGYGTSFKDWGMLGNDVAGDCVFAGSDHETMLFNHLAGHPVTFTTSNALDDYGAVTGYDPATGANDNGTEVRSAMGFRRATGLVDAQGTRHKIDAYVSIDPGDWNLMLQCTWTFGATGIGFEVPESAMQQFNERKPWDDVGDSNIVGGHYVPMVGSTSPATRATCVTWAQRQFMTKAFYEKYNDEAWIPLSKEAMKASGFNVRHIDWTTLNSLLNNL